MTNSAEDDLEAAIWAAMTAHKVTTMHPIEFIDTIKTAAMTYAAGDSDELTAMRRDLLLDATAPRPRQTSASSATGGGGAARRREQSPEGLADSPPEGATLSTGSVIPFPGQGLFKLRPQPVDNWWDGALGPDDLPGPHSETTRGSGSGSST